MKWVGILLFCVLGATLESYQSPKLWPMPQIHRVSSSDSYYISTQFQFVPLGSTSALLEQAFSRYYDILFSTSEPPSTSLTELKSVNVLVEDLDQEFIQFGTDESYNLFINDTMSILSAPTVFGAMRGLETFSQLVRFQSLPSAEIIDFPRFPWRGLLVDTSRNYQTIDTIKRAIRGISYDKMNVLHWHMSDGQSFPFQSEVYPDLTKGAYGSEYVYSIAEVADIIEYGNSYGVRVVVEFDMPSHAGPSWGKGYPFLTMNCSAKLECHNPLNRFSDGCNDFPFDATNEEVYTFLDRFISEIASVFPDNYLHMGGDEVQTLCWAVPSVLEWMHQNNMTDFSQLEQYFLTRVQQYATRNNKLIVNWEEVFTSKFDLAPGTIIEVWKDTQTLSEVARAGYGALLAYNWYLDHLDTSWEVFYSNEPDTGILTPNEQALLYGGETCMWAERVDETNFDAKVWPRNSAAAERLWSAKNVTNIMEATARLPYHRCRAFNRGINASPINPGPPCAVYYL